MLGALLGSVAPKLRCKFYLPEQRQSFHTAWTQSRRPAICYSITSSACSSSVSRSRDKRGSEVNRSPDGHRFRSEPENVQHGGLALVLELRRVDELGLGRSARPRRDRDILLAANLESHGRCREAGADIDLPELFERGVVERRHGAVSQPKEYQSAAGRHRPAVVGV